MEFVRRGTLIWSGPDRGMKRTETSAGSTGSTEVACTSDAKFVWPWLRLFLTTVIKNPRNILPNS